MWSADPWLTSFFDRDIILDVFLTFNRSRDVSRSAFGVARIREPAQLHRALERGHLHVRIFVLRVGVQRFFDPRRGGSIVNAFPGALVITISRAPGSEQTDRQRHHSNRE